MSTKSENKMQRYYAERETTGPEFGKFSVFFNIQWKTQDGKSLNQPPKTKTNAGRMSWRVFCA